MNKGGHRAQFIRCIERDDPLRRRRHADEDAVSLLQPEGSEPIGAGVDLAK